MLWEELTSEEFPKAVRRSKGVCIIPIGCVETHGNHIALGCDTLSIGHLAKVAAEATDVVVFPQMYFGEKSGAGEYPGTIIFPNRLIHRILTETCYEIARNGFDKIMILNGHGGNIAMIDHVCRQFLQDKPDFMVVRERPGMGDPKYIVEHKDHFPYLTEEDFAVLQDYVDQGKRDGHGGFCETAEVLSGNPHIVRMENFGSLSGSSNGKFDGYSQRGLYTPYGWMGNYPNSLHCDLHDGLNQRIAQAIADHYQMKLQRDIRYLQESAELRAVYDAFCTAPDFHGEVE